MYKEIVESLHIGSLDMKEKILVCEMNISVEEKLPFIKQTTLDLSLSKNLYLNLSISDICF